MDRGVPIGVLPQRKLGLYVFRVKTISSLHFHHQQDNRYTSVGLKLFFFSNEFLEKMISQNRKTLFVKVEHLLDDSLAIGTIRLLRNFYFGFFLLTRFPFCYPDFM